jgi:hypothetical protein
MSDTQRQDLETRQHHERERAYSIWRVEGRPEGRRHEHWDRPWKFLMVKERDIQ